MEVFMIKIKGFGKAGVTLLLTAVITLSIVFAVLAGKGSAPENSNPTSAPAGGNILLASGDNVTLVDGKNNIITEIFYGDAIHSSAGQTTKDIADWFYNTFKVDIDYGTKISENSPKTNIAIYGKSEYFPISVELAKEVEARPATSYVWGIAYKDGVLALYANTKAAFDSPSSLLSTGHDIFLDFFGGLEEYITDGKLVVTEELFRVHEVTAEEYEALLAQDKLDRAEEIKFLVTQFNTSDFGTNLEHTEAGTLTSEFPAASSGAPSYYPTAGEHPRVLFTKADIPAIRARIEALSGTREYDQFMQYIEEDLTGILPEPKQQGTRGVYNWDGTVLSRIQANALAYAVYGEENYGYKAIYAIKNFLLTLDIVGITSDQCREYGMVMYIAACVYDWCYDLLSEEDKYQIALGVEYKLCRGSTVGTGSYNSASKMEMGFPPTEQYAGQGHGAEFQLQRDYLSFSIAVYDELPSWYELIGGRFYNEYIPIHNAYYSAGLYPQGVANYGPWRFLADSYGGVLIQAATGISPYTTDMAKVVFNFLSHETYSLLDSSYSNNKIFMIGDGSASDSTRVYTKSKQAALLISHMLYNTEAAPLLRLIEQGVDVGYTSVGVSTVILSEYIICSSREVEELENTTWREELPLITYIGGYLGQYIARNSWDNNGAVTLMKISTRPTGNHDHRDSGTFQIYYKGLTTGSAGSYGKYSTSHHKYYHQATVSKNGILIYEPSKSSRDNGWYSGSQRTLNEARTYEGWMESQNIRGAVTGFASGYAADGVTPKYTYLAGDITKAYESSQATYVGRTMLTAYTGDKKIPMVFFVFDRVDMTKTDSIQKFLLQVNGESAPTIDAANKTVIIEDGEGQLVLQNVLGASTVEGIGGDGKQFLINGKECTDDSLDADDPALKSWGRVELSATNNASNIMVNVIYVSDAGNETVLRAERVTGYDKTTGQNVLLEGATIGNTTALFSTDKERLAEKMTFTAAGEGLMTYYVGGLLQGTWHISIDDMPVGTLYSTNDSGMISFEAPAGKAITLTPGTDIAPSGAERITYMTNGGAFGGSVSEYYVPGTQFTLPTNITRGKDIFEGWYLDYECTQRIEYIDESATGPMIVYAKWSSIFADEDYSETKINYNGVSTDRSTTVNSIKYQISDGAITTFQNRESGDDKYLFFETVANPNASNTEGQSGRGPSIYVNIKNDSSIATMNRDQITYVFKFAAGGTDTNMDLRIRVRESDRNKETAILSVSGNQVKFDGQVLAELGDEFVTVAVTFDFATGTKRAYASSHANCLTGTFSRTDRSQFTRELLSMRAFSAGAIKIGAIQVIEGDHAALISDTDRLDNKIKFPEEAILPEGINKTYIPDAGTVIPTEGITAEIGGIKHRVAGWYSDEGLTQQITAVPNGVTGRFRVYAKWVEMDYIVYPEELVINENVPLEYTAGTALTLPTDGIVAMLHGKECPLIGWYSDPELKNKITEIPASESGVFYVYAKCEEPNIIVYPENVTIPENAPVDYVAGVTVLPAPTYSGSYSGEFVGWYSDPEYKNKIEIVPAGTTGVFAVYAAFNEVFLSADVDVSKNYIVSGYGYCYEHTDVNTDNICDSCKYCIGICSDSNNDSKCDNCGFNPSRCGTVASNHTDTNGDSRCDVCNVSLGTASSGSIGVDGIRTTFNEYTAGYAVAVDNGDDDYIEIFVKSGGGPSLDYSKSDSIKKLLEGKTMHRIVYTLELSAKDGEQLLPIGLRARSASGSGSTPMIFETTSDGKLTTGYNGETIPGVTLGNEMTTVHILVDYDNEEIRYYIGDSTVAAATKEFKRPSGYSNAEEWIAGEYKSSGKGVMQIRYQGAGTIRIGSIKISYNCILN